MNKNSNLFFYITEFFWSTRKCQLFIEFFFSENRLLNYHWGIDNGIKNHSKTIVKMFALSY